MNRFCLCIVVLCMMVLPVGAFNDADVELLDRSLAQKGSYDRAKHAQIEQIEQSNMPRYEQLERLFESYKSFSYDTAYIYASKMLDEAQLIGNQNLIDEAYLKQAFIFLSSGLFHESLAVFQSIDPNSLSEEDRAIYYTNYARLCYDMGDYAHGTLRYDYIAQGNQLSEQAIRYLSPNDTVRYWSTSGLYHMKKGDYIQALEHFRLALSCSSITTHEQAIAYSSMAYLYQLTNQQESSEHYWILAAVSDLQSSTKEAVAMAIVAECFYKAGDTERAARYIHSAMDDAAYYNARHRQLSISRILPIIEEKQLQDLEQHNARIHHLSIWLYVSLGILLLSLIILANRIRATIRAHRTIQKMNTSLLIANRIKEEYIGSFFCSTSDLIARIDKYERYVKNKAKEKKLEDLQVVPTYIDAHQQRQEFNKQFDENFLHIFPTFVQEFNALLRPGEQIELKNGELLNTDLRIFALIRLGIERNEQIAQVLDYSVNTIYTYKTKIRSRSDYDTTTFYRLVMEIPSY